MTDTFAIEAALSKLINLTGKMRMLSHRAVMAAMQAALISENSVAAMEIFDAATQEFQQISEAVRGGSGKLGIPAAASVVLTNAGAQASSIQEPIKRFLSEAGRIALQMKTNKIETVELARFSTFVAHDLLAALNQLNTCVTDTLQAQLDEQHKAEEAARAVVLAAVKSISDVSMKVKLISLNASVEAARAGEHGRGFAVIAQEIRSLSEDAANSSKQIEGHLQKAAS